MCAKQNVQIVASKELDVHEPLGEQRQTPMQIVDMYFALLVAHIATLPMMELPKKKTNEELMLFGAWMD